MLIDLGLFLVHVASHLAMIAGLPLGCTDLVVAAQGVCFG